MRRGDISQQSFAFRVMPNGQQWAEASDDDSVVAHIDSVSDLGGRSSGNTQKDVEAERQLRQDDHVGRVAFRLGSWTPIESSWENGATGKVANSGTVQAGALNALPLKRKRQFCFNGRCRPSRVACD